LGHIILSYWDTKLKPFEVNSGTAKRARSLAEYRKRYSPEKSVLTSLDDMSGNNLPLYAFWKFKEWLAR